MVSRVVDGDTVQLADGRRVRLAGINTPELGHGGKPDEPWAAQARTEVERWLQQEDEGLLIDRAGRDQHGRWLGYLFSRSNGASLAAHLVGQGLAWQVSVESHAPLHACLVEREDGARARRLGIWSSGRWPRTAAQMRQGGFALVRGRIDQVERSGQSWFIELDRQLALRLSHELVGEISRTLGAPPDAWLGREVEVRGWIIDRRESRAARAGHSPFLLPLRNPEELRFCSDLTGLCK